MQNPCGLKKIPVRKKNYPKKRICQNTDLKMMDIGKFTQVHTLS